MLRRIEAKKRRNTDGPLLTKRGAETRDRGEARVSYPGRFVARGSPSSAAGQFRVLEIDGLLGGGLPIGGITEFTGLASSGRTALAFALLRGATVESACAYVDVEDTLDPKSHCGSNHPRSENKGLDAALGKMLAEKSEARLVKMEGTPGYPNRKLTLAAAPEEQVAFEHFNVRHADASDPLRQADCRAADEARERAQAPVPVSSPGKKPERPWSRLDKAIRVADQILQSGGFHAVVLDLASVPPEQALRIPSATWFRFRRAAQESDAIFLLLTQVACARSSALCVLDCSVGAASLSGNLLHGLSRTAEVARQRLSSPFAKKAPGRAVSWEASSPWMRAAGG